MKSLLAGRHMMMLRIISVSWMRKTKMLNMWIFCWILRDILDTRENLLTGYGTVYIWKIVLGNVIPPNTLKNGTPLLSSFFIQYAHMQSQIWHVMMILLGYFLCTWDFVHFILIHFFYLFQAKRYSHFIYSVFKCKWWVNSSLKILCLQVWNSIE